MIFRRRDIGEYMHRWIASLGPLNLRVHHIREPDADRDLHDHPFVFVSLVLRGWYVEERPLDGEPRPHGARTWITRRPGSLAFRWAGDAHRITNVSPGGVWTFVVALRVRDTWGFWTSDGWVDWRDFTTRKAGAIENHR